MSILFKVLRHGSVLICCLGLLLAFTTRVQAGMTLNVIADTWVGQDTPGINHDGVNDLECGMDTTHGKSREVYLKFSISSIPADFESIHLSLKACIKQDEGWVSLPALDFEIYGTNSDWGEASLTWENKPAVNSTLLGTFTIVPETQDYVVNGNAAMVAYVADLKSAGINQVSFVIKAGRNTPGSRIWISSSGWIGARLTIGSANSTGNYIVLNQLGFYPDQPKVAVVWKASGNFFYLVNSDKTDTLYTGTLTDSKIWEYSGQDVRQAVFSDFDVEGSYFVLVPGLGYSQSFKISGTVYNALAKALVKMFYFQRASTALLPEYAGPWARALGHPDDKVAIHSSAATSTRPTGTLISCPMGWYDAGDYNKYVVPSGITMYTLMLAYEQFYEFSSDFNLNLPESNNNIPDLLDEVLWNLRWMLSMQDPGDGGVYHKLTNASFENVVMPVNAKKTRYVIQKSTAATLDFAANMAQASRIFSRYSSELPGLADSCLTAAEYAWEWALANPDMVYDQAAMNQKFSPSISTGQYKDSNLTDEFFWAASELFITTGLPTYLSKIDYSSQTFYAPYWPGVGTLALMSLNWYKNYLPEDLNTHEIKNKLIDVANSLKNYAGTSAFGVPMGERSDNFKWGSNAVAGYQSMVLAQAYLLTGNTDYLNAAYANFDYVMGRNPTQYSYVTGFGNKSPKNPHHRPSEADNEVEPVPGMVVGGPHPGRQDGCSYESTLPALCYTDDFCSYATNEITIYWNAPIAYLGILFEANRENKLSPPFNPRWNSSLPNYRGTIQYSIRIYPNPADEIVYIETDKDFSGFVQIYNSTGVLEFEEKILAGKKSAMEIDISRLPAGLYFIRFNGDSYQNVTKLCIY